MRQCQGSVKSVIPKKKHKQTFTMGRKCAASFCWSNDGKNQGKSFYKFPRQFERCKKWVEYCQSATLEEEFRASGPLGLQKNKLCSDHFTADAMVDPFRFDKGLNIIAIPSVEFMIFDDMMTTFCNTEHSEQAYGEAYHDSNYENLFSAENESTGNVEYLDGAVFDIPSDEPEYVVENVENNVNLAMQVDMIADVNHDPNPNVPDPNTEMSAEQILMIARHANEMLEVHRRVESSKQAQCLSTVNMLKNKVRNTERTSKRRAKSMQRKTSEIKRKNQELKQLRKKRKMDDDILANLKNNAVLYDSVRNSMRPKKARRYNRDMRKFAVGLYLSSPRTYRMIQRSKTLCLPSKRTIKRWTNEVRFEPGLNKGFSDLEKVVVLAIDGMKIKEALNYSAKSDVFHGFPDSGLKKLNERNKSSVLATEAVAVMARGMYKPFKQGLGYFLTHNTLGSIEQLKLVENTIREVRNAGLDPLVLTMDQYATNIKMAKEAGATAEKPYFEVDGKRIYIWWDPPHLTKNTRNNVKKHNAVFGDNVATFDDIEKLHEIDSVANPRLVPKLTEKHVRVPPFSPMNVSLATRTLSQSVATGIRYYVETEALPKRALQTAAFVEMHDKLFDVFNSKTRNCFAKPLKAALQQNSQHWEFLEEVQLVLDKMFYTKKSCLEFGRAKNEAKDLTSIQRYPNYIRGFISNINALKLLWNDLYANFHADDLYTNHLCQDFLENLFSEVRRRCGSNDAPDSLQFGTAFKYAAVEACLKGFNGTNCEPDATLPLINTKDLNDTIAGKVPSTRGTAALPPLDTSKPLEITLRELNGLMYIAGASAHKLPHKKCIQSLQQDSGENNSDDAYKFIKLKQFSTESQLHLPNKKLYNIGVLCFAVFNQKFSKFLSKSKVGVKTKLKSYVTYDLFEEGICKTCFSLLIDKMFNTLIQGHLKTVKARQASKDKAKRLKRNRKAGRMCLPL